LGRASLPAGTAFPSHRVAVSELVAVESGRLSIAADDGTAWVTDPKVGTHRADAAAAATGGGGQVDAGTGGGDRAAGGGPAGALLVTIRATTPQPATEAAFAAET